MNDNRRKTKEIIKVSGAEVFHFALSEYKPWWHAMLGQVPKGKTFHVSGYNSGGLDHITEPLLDNLIDTGKMIPYQDYIIEVELKLTKVENINDKDKKKTN